MRMEVNNSVSLSVMFLALVVLLLLSLNVGYAWDMQEQIWAVQEITQENIAPAVLGALLVHDVQCKECFDVAPVLAQLQQNPNLKILASKQIERNSEAGKSLIAKYKLTRVPSLVIFGETDKALEKVPELAQLGNKQGAVILGDKFPPLYIDLASGELKGKLSITYLTSRQCKDCVDPTLHRQALASLSMKPLEERTFDEQDATGKRLIAFYAIKKLPTMLLQGDLGIYSQVTEVLSSLGTLEKDNTYVFRSPELFGPYRDLASGKVIKPEAEKSE